jgi:apolipoprotein N-acyltransferase
MRSLPSPPRPSIVRDIAAVRWGLALLSIALISLSLPTIDLPPFAFVAWLPLLVWLPTASPRRRFLFGWVAGIGYHLVIFRWIPFTVTEMTSLPDSVAVAMCIAYALWHGLHVACFAWWSEPVHRAVAARAPGLAALAVASLYATLEWLWPVVFPWSIAHALWQVPPVHAIAAFIGVPGVAAFVLLPQVALANALNHRNSKESPHSGYRPLLLGPAIQLAVLLALGVGWTVHVDASPVGDSIRVAVVQPNYTLAEKKHATFDVRRRLLDRFDAQLRALPPATFDLIVASEGAFPMFWRVDTPPLATPADAQQLPTRRIQQAIAEGPRTRAMIGGLRQLVDDPDATIANTVVFIEADGTIAGHYDKRLLVPFSETMPFSDLIPSLRNAVRGISHLRRGTTDCHFDVGPVPATCGICYETLFADETRAGVAAARLLTNFTIDTWFGRSTAPRLHLAAHSSRAVELGIPLVRSALTGISAVIDPLGRTLGALPLDATGVLDVTVPLRDISPPYRTIGPIYPWICAVLLVLLGIVRFVRRRVDSREPRPPDGVSGSGGVLPGASVDPAPRGHGDADAMDRRRLPSGGSDA